MANINELKARAKEIQRELQEGRNTADRVGGLLCDILEYDDKNNKTFESEITDLQELYVSLTQSDCIIVTGALPEEGEPNVIYRQVDQVNDPPQYYRDYMYRSTDLTAPVLMAQYNNNIDAVPILGSNNIVESGGVADRIFNITPAKETPGVAEDGHYVVNPSGNSAEQLLFAISESITLSPYNTILFTVGVGESDSGNVAVLSLYDNDNNTYTPLVANTGTGIATYVYQSIKHEDIVVRISYYKSSGAPIVYITDNIVADAVQTDAVPTKDSKKLVPSGGIYDSILQKFKLKWIDGHYINFNTGQQPSLPSYDSTDFIPIYGFESLTICTAGHNEDITVVGYAFYDNNKAFIPDSGGSITASESVCVENTVSVPTEGNACFIKFSFYNHAGADRNACYMSGANVPSAIGKVFTSAVQPIIPTDHKFWGYAMESILCIGDSLTSGTYYIPGHGIEADHPIRQSYPYYLSRMLNAEVQNAGFKGFTAYRWWNEKLNSYTYTDYDSVIIWLGTNYGLDPDELNTPGTNAYSYKQIIETILDADSEIKIFLTKVFNTQEPPHGPGLVKTNRTIDTLASEYGLGIINNSDLDPTNHPELHGNTGNIHFGKAGNIFLANRAIDSISSWFAEDGARCEFCMEQISEDDPRHYPD